MCNCGKGTSNIQSTLQNKTPVKTITAPQDCFFNKEILQNYKNLLEQIKEKNIISEAGLTIKSINSYLGLVQSALNYPDNYCLFEQQLSDFRDKILPKIIIANAS